ncbi:hypothetical protein QF028_004753 [Neobacillus sp. B4I6]
MARNQKGLKLELTKVEKSFGKNKVLKGVNLSIKPGEFGHRRKKRLREKHIAKTDRWTRICQ